MLTLVAQLFFTMTDAYAVNGEFGNTTESHHNMCGTRDTSCAPNTLSSFDNLAHEQQDANCDHCCSCHGHFTHLSIIHQQNWQVSSVKDERFPSHPYHKPQRLNTDLERPPKA